MTPAATPTIAAVASPPGRSLRGLLRVSGPATGRVLASLLQETPDATRLLTPVRLQQPTLPALLLRFAAPFSYTGEDAAELQLPGNAAMLDRLLHRAIQSSDAVRLAEPGEFTFRGYTAGKLDLTQAEGVAATIHATCDSQLRAATMLREGKLGHAASGMVDALGNLLALVEAGIDFTDQENVVPIAPDVLDSHLAKLQAELDHLLSNSRPWGAIEALPRVVLVGPPSAGKSTLFNALLGKDRAVIDAMPGTTRDVLEEPLTLTDALGRPAEVMLVDIAGLDDPTSPLDQRVQAAAGEALRGADLVLSVHASETETAPLRLPGNTPVVHVATKQDLHPSSADAVPPYTCRVSAQTGAGIDQLRETIVHALKVLPVSVRGDMLALQPRHESGLRTAAVQIKSVRGMLAAQPNPHNLPDIELLADAMRAGLDALAALGGRLTPDEVIGRVFATFCVGK
ncbi:MAG: tRNA modification GTPase [Phycisphaerales bacterium JB063]